MKRTLQLTSPQMVGADVLYAKRLLNNNPFGVFRPGLGNDFDQETAAACRQAKWELGYAKDKCTGTFGTSLEKYLRGMDTLPLLNRRRRKKRLAALTVGKKAVDEAVKWIGTVEEPPGTNIAKPFTTWYGWIGWGAPWCAVFLSYCLDKAGFEHIKPNAARWAYCPYFLADARARRYGLQVVHPHEVEKGTIALFDWDNDGVPDHIGFCTDKVLDGEVPTVEGNTSFTSSGSQSNGGAVAARTRSVSDIIAFVKAG
jgi:hypothetical protein